MKLNFDIMSVHFHAVVDEMYCTIVITFRTYEQHKLAIPVTQLAIAVWLFVVTISIHSMTWLTNEKFSSDNVSLPTFRSRS